MHSNPLMIARHTASASPLQWILRWRALWILALAVTFFAPVTAWAVPFKICPRIELDFDDAGNGESVWNAATVFASAEAAGMRVRVVTYQVTGSAPSYGCNWNTVVRDERSFLDTSGCAAPIETGHASFGCFAVELRPYGDPDLTVGTTGVCNDNDPGCNVMVRNQDGLYELSTRQVSGALNASGAATYNHYDPAEGVQTYVVLAEAYRKWGRAIGSANGQGDVFTTDQAKVNVYLTGEEHLCGCVGSNLVARTCLVPQLQVGAPLSHHANVCIPNVSGFRGHDKKFLLGHQWGHVALALPSALAGTSMPFARDCSYPEAGGADQVHDLESREWSSCAAVEGFSHFVAADLWNAHTTDAAGVFTSWELCGDQAGGAGDRRVRLENGGFDPQCVERYLTTKLANGTSTAGQGTELDWLRFFWDYHTDKGQSEGGVGVKPTHAQMYQEFKQSPPTAPRTGFDAYKAGVRSVHGCAQVTGRLTQLAQQNGVDRCAFGACDTFSPTPAAAYCAATAAVSAAPGAVCFSIEAPCSKAELSRVRVRKGSVVVDERVAAVSANGLAADLLDFCIDEPTAGTFTYEVEASCGVAYVAGPWTVQVPAEPFRVVAVNPSKPSYAAGELVEIVVETTTDGLVVTGDFGTMDSTYTPGGEQVTALGAGKYRIRRTLPAAAANTRPAGDYGVVVAVRTTAMNAAEAAKSVVELAYRPKGLGSLRFLDAVYRSADLPLIVHPDSTMTVNNATFSTAAKVQGPATPSVFDDTRGRPAAERVTLAVTVGGRQPNSVAWVDLQDQAASGHSRIYFDPDQAVSCIGATCSYNLPIDYVRDRTLTQQLSLRVGIRAAADGTTRYSPTANLTLSATGTCDSDPGTPMPPCATPGVYRVYGRLTFDRVELEPKPFIDDTATEIWPFQGRQLATSRVHPARSVFVRVQDGCGVTTDGYTDIDGNYDLTFNSFCGDQQAKVTAYSLAEAAHGRMAVGRWRLGGTPKYCYPASLDENGDGKLDECQKAAKDGADPGFTEANPNPACAVGACDIPFQSANYVALAQELRTFRPAADGASAGPHCAYRSICEGLRIDGHAALGASVLDITKAPDWTKPASVIRANLAVALNMLDVGQRAVIYFSALLPRQRLPQLNYVVLDDVPDLLNQTTGVYVSGGGRHAVYLTRRFWLSLAPAAHETSHFLVAQTLRDSGYYAWEEPMVNVLAGAIVGQPVRSTDYRSYESMDTNGAKNESAGGVWPNLFHYGYVGPPPLRPDPLPDQGQGWMWRAFWDLHDGTSGQVPEPSECRARDLGGFEDLAAKKCRSNVVSRSGAASLDFGFPFFDDWNGGGVYDSNVPTYLLREPDGHMLAQLFSGYWWPRVGASSSSGPYDRTRGLPDRPDFVDTLDGFMCLGQRTGQDAADVVKLLRDATNYDYDFLGPCGDGPPGDYQ